MKIAVVVCSCPPYRGGIGNAGARQAAALLDVGHEVVVLCPAHDDPAGRDTVDGVEVRRLRAWSAAVPCRRPDGSAIDQQRRSVRHRAERNDGRGHAGHPSDLPGIRTVVDEESGALVSLCDEGRLRDAGRSLLVDRDGRIAMAAAARRRAVERSSRRRECEAALAIAFG